MELANIGKVIGALIITMLVITLGAVVAMVVFASPGHALTNTYVAAGHGHSHH